MLIGEARWLGQAMRKIGYEHLFPMLNIGSSTWDFRHIEQPWIDRHVFAPARRFGYQAVHMDAKPDRGVHLVGDLFDPAVIAQIRTHRFRSIICSNLLEHVTDRTAVANLVQDLLVESGYLFVTCPYQYPYHPDPIDTMFRPTPDELHALFPTLRKVDEAIIRSGTALTDLAMDVCRQPIRFPLKLVRRFFAKREPKLSTPKASTPSESRIPWMFRYYQASCLVGQRRI